MNGPFQVAQAGGTATSSTNGTPARIYKLTKPLTDQAVMVNLGYDQNVKIDFSAIANEKITLVHIGEKLIILFDNESTVTVEPFFKSRADGPGNDTRDEITVEMAPGRDISVKEFAALFPITTDASVLPAAGGNAQASGAYFSPYSVDPLDPVLLNQLAPQEELGNFVYAVPLNQLVPQEELGNLPDEALPPVAALPTILAGIGLPLVVDESFIPLVGSQTLVPNTPNSNKIEQNFAGSFTINAPADVQSVTYGLTINNSTTNLIDVATGQFVRLVPNGSGRIDGVITDNNNHQITVFTLTVDGSGTVTFEVLEASRQFVQSPDVLEGISPNAGLVSLTATVTDNNGATASTSIDLGPLITVFDDVPTAVADSDMVAAGTQGPATGNVLSGGTDAIDTNTTDGVADVKGADGAVVSGVAAGNTDANLENLATLNTAIQGTYGKLTLLADGSYSYVRDAGTAGGVNDVFTYTIKDGDGDLSHTTLTVHIDDSGVTTTVPVAGAAGALVSEAGLPARTGEPAGSNEPSNSETTTGSISYTAADGPAVVTIDGTAVTFVGQAFVHAGVGTLTITSIAAGSIGYSYTLADNTSGDATTDTFAVMVTDKDGDHDDKTLTINIVDDVPTAVADTDSVAAGSYGPATGNVLLGGNDGIDTNTTDGVADVKGADGAVVSGVAAGNTDANLENLATLNTAIQGTYGKLTLLADGSYSYVRDAGTAGGVNDVFTYTIKDGDGDLSHTTLTISVGDSTPTDVIPVAGGATTTVYEKGLAARGAEPAGSGEIADSDPTNNSDPSETVAGTIAFTSLDGVSVVSLGGHALTNAAQTFTDATGSLTASYSYDAVSGAGTISYSYTLLTNTSGDATNVSFPVVVTDADGDNVPAGNLVINIVDDVPTAHADTDSVASDAQTLNFDDFGLGDNSETPISSPYHGFNFIQTGVYNPPGSGPFATYAPHSGSNLAFVGEKNGVDQPGYTGTPGDPITIAHTDGSRFTALGAWFSSNGSDPMTITVSGYVNGIKVGSFSQDIHQGGAGGPTYVNLSVLGSVDKITLDAPNYFGFDDFSYVDNSSATGNVITGADTTNNGVDMLGADGAKITGVVGVTSDAISDGSHNFQVTGQYGTLVINESGDYTYTRFDGSPIVANDVFTYTLTDGDGDFSTATLTIHIDDSGVTTTVPVAGAAGALVSEAGLPARTGEPAGSNEPSNSETTTGSISYTAADGPAVVTIDGTAVTFVGQAFVHAGVGTLTITSIAAGSIGYSYTLADNTSGDATSDSFAVVVTDKDGDHNDKTLTISIVDDAPTATVDTNFVNEGALLTVVAAGGVLSNDVAGADGFAAGGGVVGVRAAGIDTTTAVATGVATSIIGLHGTLVLQANGGYTYQSTSNNIGSNATDVFVYTIKDGDGDLSTTTLTINLADVTIVAPADSDVTVYESALDMAIAGSDLAAGTITGSLGTNSALETDATNQLNATGGFGGLTYALVSGGNAATAGTYGTIKVNTDGSYIYTLTKSFDTSPDADNGANIEGAESFQYKVTDANGNTATGTIKVNIVDDVPTASNEVSQNVAEGATVTGVLDFVGGADGATVTQINGTNLIFGGDGFSQVIDIGAGLIKVKADGSYSFAADAAVNSGGAVPVTATYTVKDGDGDTATANIAFAVTDANHPAGGSAAASVDDDGLTGGNAASTVGDLDANLNDDPLDTSEKTFTGTLGGNVGLDGAGANGFTFAAALNGVTATVGLETVTYSLAGNVLTAKITTTSDASRLNTNLFTVEITNQATGAFKVTLLDNVLHAGGPNDEATDASVNLGYVITDADGSSVAGNTLTVTFDDDAPTAVGDTIGMLIAGAFTTGNLLTNDAFGADGPAVSGQVTFINGAHGTVVYNNNGTFTYTPTAGYNGTDSFTYTIKDGDGDISTATVTLSNVHTNSVPAAGTVTATVDDEGLTGGIAGDGQSSGDVAGQAFTASGTLTHNYSTDNKAASDPINFSPMDGTTGLVGTETVTYSWNPANNTLTASSAARGPIFTVVVDGGSDTTGNGAYVFTLLKPVLHESANGENDATVALTYQVKDATAPTPDTANGTLTITIDDDTPVANAESATATEQIVQDLNAAFVLDFSGSIDNTELNQMLLAVKAAGDKMFADATGAVKIELIGFASTSVAAGPFTTKAAFDAQIDAWNPSVPGGSRPLNSSTDYSDGIQTLMSHYTPIAGQNNQVFFLSDGNPNENTGSSGQSLNDTVRPLWNTFVNNVAAPITVTTIGIGNGIDNAHLQQVDVDGGSHTPLNVAQFSDLIDTLVTLVGNNVTGNVLANGDRFGADGGRILSITFDNHTYTWNGKIDGTASIVETDSGGNTIATIAGTTLQAVGTTLTGQFTFYFAAASGGHVAGDWTYSGPHELVANSNETFTYVLTDNDGDLASAALTVAVTAVNDAPVTTVPVAQSVAEDTNLVFSLGKLISIADVDANGGNETVNLGVLHGTLNLASILGLTVTGNGTGSVVLTGSVANVNAALNGLTYKGVQDYNGADTLTITINDNGNTGAGGGKSDTDTVAITVTAVNDAPVITAPNGGNPASISINENTTAVSDIDATDPDVGQTLTYSISGGADAAKFTINSSTGVLSFLSAPDFENPTDAGGNNVYDVIVQASDGNGGTDTQNIAVTVNNVNDPPSDIIFTGNGALSATTIPDNGTDITRISSNSTLFTLSSVDPDNASGFTYTFSGSATHNVTVDGNNETFTMDGSSGAVTTTQQDYDNGVQTIMITTPRTQDPSGNTRVETVTLRLGTNTSGDSIDGSAVANDQVIYGFAGDDTLTGGSGRDSIYGGDNDDTIAGAANDIELDGGSGTDTLEVNANFTSSADSQIKNIENVVLNASGLTVNLSNQTESFTITGSAGADSITAGSGNDIIVGSQNDTLLVGGGGNDTLRIAANLASTGDGQITGIENVTLTAAATLNLANQTEAFTITGSSGADTITGGSAADSISAGAGNDTINGSGNDTLLDGGADIDTLQLGANFTSASNAQIVNIENVTPTASAIVNLSNQTEDFTITGSAGVDSITAGSGDDTIVGAVNDSLLAGGGGTDTLQVGANFTSTGDGQITGIETVQLTSAATLNLANQTEGFKIAGSSGVDTITGGSGNDTINAGAGNDTLAGGLGIDEFRLASNTGTDTITDFVAGTDNLGFLGTSGVSTYSTFAGIQDSDDNRVVIISATNQTTASILAADAGDNALNTYVLVFNEQLDRAEVWFDTNWNDTGNRSLVGILSNITTQAQFNAIGAGDIVSYASSVDPIVLDLGTQGISFSSLENGVTFDINHDGAQDQVVWTTNGQDGILALDLDGSGKIESGKELFTPNFNGGKFADGIAALASLDGNHDGVINGQDQAFDGLVVWQDANHNGVSETGELTKLGDLGISSISLTTTSGGAPIDGQNIAGTGSFTYADGTTGTFVEVDLDASLGAAPAQPDNHPADAHDLSLLATVAAEIDHGGGNIDLSVLHQGGVDHAPAPLGQGGEAAHPGLDAGATTPAAIAIMHEQAALAMQLAAY